MKGQDLATEWYVASILNIVLIALVETFALVPDFLVMGVIKEVAYSPHMILSPIFLTRKSSGDSHGYSIHSESKASKQSQDDREFQNGESPNCS